MHINMVNILAELQELPHNVKYKHGRDRFLTFFMYLNEVEEGGHTAFVRAGPDGWPTVVTEYAECRGLKITPVPNTCVLWYNLLPENQQNGL
jgi:hypothetical protein